jgi:hypothetical protein
MECVNKQFTFTVKHCEKQYSSLFKIIKGVVIWNLAEKEEAKPEAPFYKYLIVGAGTSSVSAYRAIKASDPKAKVSHIIQVLRSDNGKSIHSRVLEKKFSCQQLYM